MKRSRLVLLVVASVVCVLAVMVGVFYGVEDWRGARAWDQAQRKLAAAGESLDPATLIPPPVPDERNVALIPLFARALDYRVDPATSRLIFGSDQSTDAMPNAMPFGKEGGRPAGQVGSWMSARALSLEGVRDYYAKRKEFPPPEPDDTAAEGVLRALTRFAPVFQELEEALSVRPEGRFPVDWPHEPPATLRLPHYNLIQKMTTALRLRAVANLAAARPAEAARDVAMAFRLRETIQPEPLIIGHLVIVTCDGLLLQAVWEGLAQRRWTAAELNEIQAGLRRDDLLVDYARALRGERDLFMHRTLELVRRTGDWRAAGLWPDNAGDSPYPRELVWMMNLGPRGWIDASEANLCLGYQEILTGVMDQKARRVRPDRIKADADERNADNRVLSPTMVMTKLALPVMESVLIKTTRTQAACEQAEVACALERCFLERGAYPETLDALVPAYLDRVPNDLVDGAPMRYVRTDDGRYRLYAVGWNGRDDGGVVAWPRVPDNTFRTDDKEGDWVWQYTPAPLPEKSR